MIRKIHNVRTGCTTRTTSTSGRCWPAPSSGPQSANRRRPFGHLLHGLECHGRCGSSAPRRAACCHNTEQLRGRSRPKATLPLRRRRQASIRASPASEGGRQSSNSGCSKASELQTGRQPSVDVPVPVRHFIPCAPRTDRVRAGEDVRECVCASVRRARPRKARSGCVSTTTTTACSDQRESGVSLPASAEQSYRLSPGGVDAPGEDRLRSVCGRPAGRGPPHSPKSSSFSAQVDDFDIVMYRFGPDPIRESGQRSTACARLH